MPGKARYCARTPARSSRPARSRPACGGTAARWRRRRSARAALTPAGGGAAGLSPSVEAPCMNNSMVSRPAGRGAGCSASRRMKPSCHHNEGAAAAQREKNCGRRNNACGANKPPYECPAQRAASRIQRCARRQGRHRLGDDEVEKMIGAAVWSARFLIVPGRTVRAHRRRVVIGAHRHVETQIAVGADGQIIGASPRALSASSCALPSERVAVAAIAQGISGQREFQCGLRQAVLRTCLSGSSFKQTSAAPSPAAEIAAKQTSAAGYMQRRRDGNEFLISHTVDS